MQAVKPADQIKLAQLTTASTPQPAAARTGDVAKPAAMARREGWLIRITR
jgi:hypothetical protein